MNALWLYAVPLVPPWPTWANNRNIPIIGLRRPTRDAVRRYVVLLVPCWPTRSNNKHFLGQDDATLLTSWAKMAPVGRLVMGAFLVHGGQTIDIFGLVDIVGQQLTPCDGNSSFWCFVAPRGHIIGKIQFSDRVSHPGASWAPCDDTSSLLVSSWPTRSNNLNFPIV